MRYKGMDKLGDVIAKRKWFEPAETALNAVAETTLNPLGQNVRNFLHGTWLGHPLHPMLTDVPVGAWTARRRCIQRKKSGSVLTTIWKLGDRRWKMGR
jgi:hypothetical protein